MILPLFLVDAKYILNGGAEVDVRLQGFADLRARARLVVLHVLRLVLIYSAGL